MVTFVKIYSDIYDARFHAKIESCVNFKKGFIQCNDAKPTCRFVHVADSCRGIVGVYWSDGVASIVRIKMATVGNPLVIWILTLILSLNASHAWIVVGSKI